MAIITIELSDEQKKRVETRAAEEGHATLSEYVRALIIQDTAPPNSPQSQEELNAMVTEGFASPATEMTKRDWEEMRNRVITHGKAKAG